MKRFIGVLGVIAVAAICAASLDLGAQSNGDKPAPPSNEWPTYGHDPGGVRFSPASWRSPYRLARSVWLGGVGPALAGPSGSTRRSIRCAP